MKTCTKCKLDKPPTDFFYKSKPLNIRYAHCKTCHWTFYQKPQYLKNKKSLDYKRKRKIYLKGYQRKRKLKSYNLTPEDYINLVASQNNLCGICGKEETCLGYKSKAKSPLALDHCHKTNKFRGLLCKSCNVGLGFFKDDIEIMKKAIEYLITHSY